MTDWKDWLKNSFCYQAERYEYYLLELPKTETRYAWKYQDSPAVIAALTTSKRAIIETRVAYLQNNKATEIFPWGEARTRRFVTTTERRCQEAWPNFVHRANTEALKTCQDLFNPTKLIQEPTFPYPPEKLLISFTHHSQAEWQERFGQNLITLHEKYSPFLPAGQWLGQDIKKIAYLFHYDGQNTKTARTLFDCAETITSQIEQITQQIFAFVEKKEIQKYGPQVGKLKTPSISHFKLRYNKSNQIEVSAYMWAEEFYHYMEVKLENGKPIAAKYN